MKNYSRLCFFLLFFFFSIKVQAKNYDDQNFICADEIGPILEFHIPKFEDSKNIKDIMFKLFKKENRNQYIKKSGTIQKKSSPIDNTYFHYEINYISNDEKAKNEKFEFYPPTMGMFQIQGTQFVDLVCWKK